MKTYQETVREVAEIVWENGYNGGEGRIEVGMIDFIFEETYNTVYKDIQSMIQTIEDEYRSKQ